MKDYGEANSTSQSVLRRITGIYPQLSSVEARIADYVVEYPFEVIRSSIDELAGTCGVSTASITRFCKKIGCAGFKELKIVLAQEVGSLAPQMMGAKHGENSGYIAQVLQQSIDGMKRTVSTLDGDMLAAAIQAIADARTVDIYGVGESYVVAESLQMKLCRLGVLANLYSNPHLQIMSTASLQPGDAAIGISLSGCTEETVDAIAFAAKRGATTIAITNFPEFPLAEKADILLRTNAIETIFPHSSIGARQAQHIVVDLIFVGLLVDHEEKFLEAYEYYNKMITRRGR